MWIDCHAHLDRLPPGQLSAAIAEALSAGVTVILSAATDLPSAAAVISQCQAFPSLYGALGISPFDSRNLPEQWDMGFRSMLNQERIIAVGEIGLDQTNPSSPSGSKYPAMEIQLPVFEKQLMIAKEHDLPVVVHSRGVEKRVAEICRSFGITRALFHCFTGDAAALEVVLDCGYFVSFSGIVTFSPAVRDLARRVPLDRLLIETDTPYLAPVPHRGKTNRPAWAALVGEAVASIKGQPAGQLQSALLDNFNRLFLPASP
jgi:TatD DNase family protein